METLLAISIALAKIQVDINELLEKPKLEITLAELPIEMQFIALCESGARQHYKNGSLVLGPFKEVGVMQIHPVHFKRAKELGYNIYTGIGNMAFAHNVLYKENKLKDWEASAKCWKPKLTMK